MPPRWFPGSGAFGAPTFIDAENTTSALNVTFSGTRAGDFLILAIGSNQNNWSGVGGWQAIVSDINFGGGPPYLRVITHTVTPQDTFPLSFVASSFPTFGCMVGLALRHTFGATDGIGTALNTSNNTSNPTNSYTDTIAGDVGIWIALTQGNTNDISAAPSGYTLAANAHVAATGAHQGMAIAYKLNLGAPGTIAIGNATAILGAGSAVATLGLALQGFNTAY
jgi:hypothetical protein